MTPAFWGLLLLCGLLFAVGLFLLLADLLRLPTGKASRAFVRTVKREEKKGKDGALDTALGNLAVFLAGNIRLSETRKSDIARMLAAADMKITPEMHVANCFVKAGVAAVLAPPMLAIFPALFPVMLAVAVGIFFGEYAAPEQRVAEVREEIEYELPLLVNRIESMLRHTRDVVSILDSYRRNAGPSLARELTVTVADMQSGNAQEALARLEARVNLPAVSDIARGLSAVIDGNDPVGYWAALSARLTDNRRQILMRKVNAVPAKVKRLSFLLLGCIVILYMTVICTHLFSALGVLL